MIRLSITALALLLSVSALSQADLTSWTALALNYKANDKLTLVVKPIHRRNNDLSGHDNTSIDIIANYKLGKGWAVSILDRHFFVPDRPDMVFTFFDIKNSFRSGKFKTSNGFRYHLGRFDARDFVRWFPGVTLITDSALTPFVSIDFFMDKDFSDLAAARYTAGVNYKLNATSGLSFIFWRQQGYSDRPLATQNNLYLTYSYNIDGFKKATTPANSN